MWHELFLHFEQFDVAYSKTLCLSHSYRVNMSVSSFTILSSSLFCKHWQHWRQHVSFRSWPSAPSAAGADNGEDRREGGNGQGQSPEKVTGNRHLTAITSAHKQGVKCQQDNIIISKNPKLHSVVSPPGRTESILVKPNKQKGNCVWVSVCVCMFGEPSAPR